MSAQPMPELVSLSYLLAQRPDLELVLNPDRPSLPCWVGARRWILVCTLERTAVLMSTRDRHERIVAALETVSVAPEMLEWRPHSQHPYRNYPRGYEEGRRAMLSRARARGLASQRAQRAANTYSGGRKKGSASHNGPRVKAG